MTLFRRYTPLALLLLAACASKPGLPQEDGRHINTPPAATGTIPQPVASLPPLPKPKATPRTETFSVVVSNLAVNDLLFALGRDAGVNIDVHPDVVGNVTLNALNQTLPQILDRISKQVDIRWTQEDGMLVVEPDTPYLKTYRLDYFNIVRNVKTNVSIANAIASTGSGAGAAGTNSSSTEISATSVNDFWKTLEKNLQDILLDVDKLVVRRVTEGSDKQNTTSNGKNNAAQAIAPAPNSLTNEVRRDNESSAASEKKGESALKEGKEANHVIVNAETGTLVIRASKKKHDKVAEYLAQVGASAQRQVLIEATVVEVTLGDQYQGGVDWSQVSTGSAGWSMKQLPTAGNLATVPYGLIQYSSESFNASIKLLEQFGSTRVLSSPKIMALNNQTAIMKVVEEQVYFTLEVDEEEKTTNTTPPLAYTKTTYKSKLHTVPIGLMLQVTPQVAEGGVVALSIRPTITNISGYVEDPAYTLYSANKNLAVKSLVPTIQVREFDSTLQIPSGQIAVLGGLIQDVQSNDRTGLPVISRLPFAGDLFSYRNDKVRKIELVIFLRPVQVKNGELPVTRQLLPGKDFFDTSREKGLSAFSSGLIYPESSAAGGGKP